MVGSHQIMSLCWWVSPFYSYKICGRTLPGIDAGITRVFYNRVRQKCRRVLLGSGSLLPYTCVNWVRRQRFVVSIDLVLIEF